MAKVRGIRGATTADGNTKEAILDATRELLEGLVEANDIDKDDIAAANFSTTRDLNAAFPALAARKHLGWDYVALMCSHEMDVPDAQPLCIRVLLLVNTEKSARELSNLYLRGAANLRDQSESVGDGG
jgi:chorismate mutase